MTLPKKHSKRLSKHSQDNLRRFYTFAFNGLREAITDYFCDIVDRYPRYKTRQSLIDKIMEIGSIDRTMAIKLLVSVEAHRLNIDILIPPDIMDELISYELTKMAAEHNPSSNIDGSKDLPTDKDRIIGGRQLKKHRTIDEAGVPAFKEPILVFFIRVYFTFVKPPNKDVGVELLRANGSPNAHLEFVNSLIDPSMLSSGNVPLIQTLDPKRLINELKLAIILSTKMDLIENNITNEEYVQLFAQIGINPIEGITPPFTVTLKNGIYSNPQNNPLESILFARDLKVYLDDPRWIAYSWVAKLLALIANQLHPEVTGIDEFIALPIDCDNILGGMDSIGSCIETYLPNISIKQVNVLSTELYEMLRDGRALAITYSSNNHELLGDLLNRKLLWEKFILIGKEGYKDARAKGFRVLSYILRY